MATASKRVSKISGKAPKKPSEKATVEKTGGAKREVIEKKFRIELGSGRFVDFRITIASAPKVGSGPRPKSEEMLLMRWVGEGQLMAISAEPGRYPTAGIKVGSGGPPTGGN